MRRMLKTALEKVPICPRVDNFITVALQLLQRFAYGGKKPIGTYFNKNEAQSIFRRGTWKVLRLSVKEQRNCRRQWKRQEEE